MRFRFPNPFRRKRAPYKPGPMRQDRSTAERAADDHDYRLRRWEAAETHRLNKAHWQRANGNSINADLASDLRTLWARCMYEAANNPMIAGVIETHTTDLVGKEGPKLRVLSDSDAYNDGLEKIWQSEFWPLPDMRGKLSGAGLLRQANMMWWTHGDILFQEVSRPRTNEFSVLPIHPRRLWTPDNRVGDPSIVLGVQRSREGVPQRYWISDIEPAGEFTLEPDHWRPIPADMIFHCYDEDEPGQVRGYPKLASVLSVAADLRDFDAEVLESARNAANQSVYWYSDHPDIDPITVNDEETIERGVQTTGPPGWKPATLDATQPSARYVEFHKERLRELGRPVNMPMMMVLLSSADSNFSAAHYDGQVYMRGLESRAGCLERQILNPWVNRVAREAGLLKRIPARPERVTYQWTWPKPPYVNPKQVADSVRVRMEDGHLDPYTAAAMFQLDFDEVAELRAKANQMLEALDLPPLPVSRQSTPQESLRDTADQLDEAEAETADA